MKTYNRILHFCTERMDIFFINNKGAIVPNAEPNPDEGSQPLAGSIIRNNFLDSGPAPVHGGGDSLKYSNRSNIDRTM